MKRRFYLTLGIFLWLSATLLILTPNWPHLYYRLSPQASANLAKTISYLPATASAKPQTAILSLPTLDPKLPIDNGLIIDTIGVRGQIHEGDNWEEILKTGVWRVPNFGTPETTGTPIILAAHRWGYLSWTAAFRKLNSFYNLPNLKIGDTLVINWKQRQYKYKVYSSSSGTNITDYSADLILYTCQMWDSPTRIFKYAKRIN